MITLLQNRNTCAKMMKHFGPLWRETQQTSTVADSSGLIGLKTNEQLRRFPPCPNKRHTRAKLSFISELGVKQGYFHVIPITDIINERHWLVQAPSKVGNKYWIEQQSKLSESWLWSCHFKNTSSRPIVDARFVLSRVNGQEHQMLLAPLWSAMAMCITLWLPGTNAASSPPEDGNFLSQQPDNGRHILPEMNVYLTIITESRWLLLYSSLIVSILQPIVPGFRHFSTLYHDPCCSMNAVSSTNESVDWRILG